MTDFKEIKEKIRGPAILGVTIFDDNFGSDREISWTIAAIDFG